METLRASLNEQPQRPDSWPLIWIWKENKITSNTASPQTMPSPEDLKQLARANMLITQSKSDSHQKFSNQKKTVKKTEERFLKKYLKKGGGGGLCVCVWGGVGGWVGGMYNTRYLCNRDFHYKKKCWRQGNQLVSQRYGQSNLCHSPWGKPRQS